MRDETSKDFIREKIRKIRESLGNPEIISKSRAVERNFFKLSELENVKHLLIYMAKDKEVQTKEIINHCLGGKINIYLPAVDSPGKRISFYRVTNIKNDLGKGAFGIFQPRKSDKNMLKDLKLIDLIVVPGFAFDKKGGRVGSGKGFYDKFLSTVPSGKRLIALAFEYQVVDEITLFDHDVGVHKIVTEKRIISCKEDKLCSEFNM